jgi:hypothetical protein
LISVAGAGVATTRIGDAAHGVLSERCGDRAEAEEGSECKCEREFHDPAPLVEDRKEKLACKKTNGLAGKRKQACAVRSVVAKPMYDDNKEKLGSRFYLCAIQLD